MIYVYIYICTFHSKINKVINITLPVILVIILLFIIFIIVNRKWDIINDTGFNQILLFSIGMMLYSISVYFSTYTSYLGCSFNFFFKHVGISLSIYIFYIYITFGYELGVVNEADIENKFFSDFISSFNKYNFSIVSDKSNKNCSNIEYSLNKNVVKSLEMINENERNRQEKPIYENNITINNINTNNNNNTYITSNYKNNEQCNENQNDNYSMNENGEQIESFYKILSYKRHILNAHMINYHFIILYPLIIIITLSLLIIHKFIVKTDDIIQSENGKWFYKCNLEKPNLIYNILEVLIIVVILLKGKYVLSMNCVFEVTKYITYSSIIAIVLGPLIPVRNKIAKHFIYIIIRL